MDMSQIGRAGELAIELYTLVTARGEVDIYSPVVDDDHIDLVAVVAAGPAAELDMGPEAPGFQHMSSHVVPDSSLDRLRSVETPSELPPAPAGSDRRLRAMDWTALGLLALTAVWAAAAYATTVASTNASIPFDAERTLIKTLWVPGVSGVVAGLAALSNSKGRPRWPGVLALCSPLVAVFGWMMAFATAWSEVP